MTHRTKLRVRFYELDPYNHVNHSVYISYFESARVELLSDAGHSLATMKANGQVIIVSEINTRFHASAEADDELTIETEIVGFKRVTSKWRQRILRGDELIASQDLRAAMLTVDGKPIRFPAEMVADLEQYTVGPD